MAMILLMVVRMDMVGIWDDRPSGEDIGYSQGKWEAKGMVMMVGKMGQLD